MSLSKSVIQITNLHKAYGDLKVLKGVDVTANRGDVISLIGSSGSGKSTLTSALTGTHIPSKELSNNQGVHTTSVSTLYEAENQMKVIDSPGVRDIGIEQLSNAEILAGFKEINELASKCEFPKCGHEDDEGCAVIKALNNDDIEQSRYNNFMILNEAANL